MAYESPRWGTEQGSGPSGPRAGFGLRMAGWLIDALILNIIAVVVRNGAGGAGNLVDTLVGIAYIVGFIGSPRGQTPGMMVTRIRVVSISDGGPIGYLRSTARWLASIVSALALLIGYFWMLWDREKQTWHDKAAQSVVVPAYAAT
ncbi:MAG TPA: RDD family protein [Acidimicrobiales bacterium]|nr:RDD family protein [Acidimicrobiales bacterium]